MHFVMRSLAQQISSQKVVFVHKFEHSTSALLTFCCTTLSFASGFFFAYVSALCSNDTDEVKM